MKIIEVIVTPSGETRVESNGFTGNSCRDASKFIEQALGTQTTETLKAEFHQTQATNSSIRTGNQ